MMSEVTSCLLLCIRHSGHRIAVLHAPREQAQAGGREAVYKRPPDTALP
ncbi:unnamed protein product, partial [Staurois parvus]